MLPDVRNSYASNEEWYYSWYVNQLLERGILTGVTYQPAPFSLSSPVKKIITRQLKKTTTVKEKMILRAHEYTADFILYWNPSYEGYIFEDILSQSEKPVYYLASKHPEYGFLSVIDIKGSFNGTHNTSASTFPLNQKWVYQRYKLLVQKVVVPAVFTNTFCPDRYFRTDMQNGYRKSAKDLKRLDSYLKNLNFNYHVLERKPSAE